MVTAISESCTITSSFITMPGTFYSRIVEDLISKPSARPPIIISLSGSSSVLSI